MARTVGIGLQSFEKIRENHCFYVDKTNFIKEWWENQDEKELSDTVQEALQQIEEKKYEAALVEKIW